MGSDKGKIEDLLGRIDELIRILRFLIDDLTEISDALKASVGMPLQAQESSPTEEKSTITTQQTLIQEETPATQAAPEKTITIENIQDMFPPDLANLLYFEDAGEHIIVKPRQYLGSDNFRRVASIIRDRLSGEYISAGKDSHFRVPKT